MVDQLQNENMGLPMASQNEVLGAVGALSDLHLKPEYRSNRDDLVKDRRGPVAF